MYGWKYVKECPKKAKKKMYIGIKCTYVLDVYIYTYTHIYIYK